MAGRAVECHNTSEYNCSVCVHQTGEHLSNSYFYITLGSCLEANGDWVFHHDAITITTNNITITTTNNTITTTITTFVYRMLLT